MGEVTIKDIAEYTGVSYATVSRTLNHLSGVSPVTRDKVLAAAEELGYRPNILARSLKTNKTNTIIPIGMLKMKQNSWDICRTSGWMVLFINRPGKSRWTSQVYPCRVS